MNVVTGHLRQWAAFATQIGGFCCHGNATLKFSCFAVSQSKFVAFFPYGKTFNSDTFDYDALAKTDYVYMRWKEHFLVPDHTIKDINGASFAGFYYICFQKSTSRVEGYYFHRNSEW